MFNYIKKKDLPTIGNAEHKTDQSQWNCLKKWTKEGMMFLAYLKTGFGTQYKQYLGRGGDRPLCACSVVPYQGDVLFCLRTDRNISSGGLPASTHTIATPIVRNV